MRNSKLPYWSYLLYILVILYGCKNTETVTLANHYSNKLRKNDSYIQLYLSDNSDSCSITRTSYHYHNRGIGQYTVFPQYIILNSFPSTTDYPIDYTVINNCISNKQSKIYVNFSSTTDLGIETYIKYDSLEYKLIKNVDTLSLKKQPSTIQFLFKLDFSKWSPNYMTIDIYSTPLILNDKNWNELDVRSKIPPYLFANDRIGNTVLIRKNKKLILLEHKRKYILRESKIITKTN